MEGDTLRPSEMILHYATPDDVALRAPDVSRQIFGGINGGAIRLIWQVGMDGWWVDGWGWIEFE